ncbi:MAG: adenylate/guanylate cyclase domain-containing protein, partial [SAR202 cluster bacterium]|nr:adenylate/guanylate cyclase domain-containing protein [SAR202 cluster bacterium]
MLFADCRGFTKMMHEHGPQAVRPVIDRFFRVCSGIVVAQDGIIDHFLGDAVLAFFNVPIRHEDHAARAVRAALEIQKAVAAFDLPFGGRLQVGMGITTGMAYTGVVGSDSCSDYTALGDAVNIASRIQGHAAPGEVLVAEETYLRAKDAFRFGQQRAL